MKNKKLLITLSALLSAVLVGVVVLVCVLVGGKKVENIDVLKNDMPQLVYVQGNDLNLSTGKLTALIDDETVEIPLNDSDVSISGYDKDKLGEQVLTITYEGQTTTIKVTVVPRVVVQKYEGSYFVEEPFNYEKGELLITNDDGTDFIVPINDETVTVSDFTTESANAALPVTVTYQKDGVSYSGTFNVAVYDVATIEFKSPNKKDYQNHDTALDVSGGYISLKNADETLVRYQVLTTDMVSGFDLTAATLAHRETPLVQTLTVTYLGHEKTYDVQISYSDLSLIRLRAEQMKDLEWTDSKAPADCTPEMGENALEAMSVYFDMTDAQKADVTTEEIETIAKVAATYGLDKWQTAFESYSDAFYLQDGNLYWNCKDFDKTKAVYTSLKEKNPVIYEDSLILTQMATDFANTVIVAAADEDSEDITVGEILSAVYSTETMDNFAGQLELMITLYETLKDVPVEWTKADLETTYSEDVEAAWVILRESEYTHIQYRSLYSFVSAWREKDDFFEILYEYYYDENDLTKINAFKDFRLPGQLEELYTLLYNAKTQIEYMVNGYQAESTDFMYAYESALKLKANILASDNEMEKDLYSRLEFDYLIGDGSGGYVLYSFDGLFTLFRRTTAGYLYHFNAYLGVPEFEGLWKQNLSILENVEAGGEEYYASPEFAAAVETMFQDYLALSPMQQVMFMNLLNPYYAPMQASRYPAKVWDDSETTYNSFVYFVYKHYRNVLPESTHDAFSQLMLACENLANSSIDGYAMEGFTQGMQTVADYLDAAPDGDAQAFKAELEWFYDDYYELATVKFADLSNPVMEDLGVWEGDFQELYSALTEAFFMSELNNAFQQQSRPTIPLGVFAAYEKAQIIADRLLASGEEAVIKAYYFDVMSMDMVMFDGSPVTLGGTADFLMFYIRNSYTSLLRGSLFTEDLLWDYYNEINGENADGLDLKGFLADASDLYYTFVYWNTVGSSETDYKFYTDADQVMKVLKNYRSLSIDQQHFVAALDSYGMYRNSIRRFAQEQAMSSDALAAVEQLLKVESYYTFYMKYPDASSEEGDTYLSLLDDELQILLSDYYYLSQDTAALEKFTSYFGETYDYYLAKCEEAGLETTFTPPVAA